MMVYYQPRGREHWRYVLSVLAIVYGFTAVFLATYGLNSLIILLLYLRHRHEHQPPPP